MVFTPSPPRPSPSAECTPPTTHIVPHLNVPSSASKSASQGLPRTPPPSTTNGDVNAVLYTLLRKLHTASRTKTTVCGIRKDKVSQYTQFFDTNRGLDPFWVKLQASLDSKVARIFKEHPDTLTNILALVTLLASRNCGTNNT